MGTDFSEMLFLSVFFWFDFNFIFNCGSMMLLILLRYLPASNNEMEINFVHAEIHLPLWFLVLLVGAFIDSLLLSVRGSMILLWKNCVIFLNGKYWRSQLYITLWDPFSFILLSFLFSFAATDTKTTFTLGFTVTVSFLFCEIGWVFDVGVEQSCCHPLNQAIILLWKRSVHVTRNVFSMFYPLDFGL